jgi:hypothetical protein
MNINEFQICKSQVIPIDNYYCIKYDFKAIIKCYQHFLEINSIQPLK